MEKPLTYSRKVPFSGSRDDVLERVMVELKKVGWRNFTTKGRVLRAEHGSPFMFRLFGVLLGGKRFIPANLSVWDCGDEKTMYIHYEVNPGKYEYKYFPEFGTRTVREHMEQAADRIWTAGSQPS
ncbi:hypothetical protein [Haloactinospora alba]|uniref:hypothetical protein n=1 Tax=Haloactinospora alba TaxID=405555 RepID=UPI001153E085|nr:hypothetical protein [Haloactinospora alba]